MTELPERSEWNGDPEPFEELHSALSNSDFVEGIEHKPGGAMDAARIELAQYTGTVPREVVDALYWAGLEIHTVGGYKTVSVGRPERAGGSLPDELETRRER